MSAHTPGPWSVELVGMSDTGPNGVEVCEVVSERSRVCEYVGYHDALLIAAAPELLAALRDVLGWIPNSGGEWHTSAPLRSIERARDAIAKATGAQP